MIWLIISLGGLGACLVYTGRSRIQEAQKRYNTRRAAYDHAEEWYKARQRKTDAQLRGFGKEHLEATEVLGRAAVFLKKARVKDRKHFEQAEIPADTLNRWQGASVSAIEVLGAVGTSVVSGALTAAGIYGLVGELAAASTGTAIATLSGVAADNATLAWLGGGTLAAGGGGMALGAVVLGGLVVAPTILVSSFFVHAKAATVETAVEQSVCEMDRAEASMSDHIAYLDIVQQRVAELWKATGELKRALEQLLVNADPSDEQDVFQVAKVATSLGRVLDAAVLDKNGKPVTDEVKVDV